MLTYFDKGINRVWYSPSDFQTGLNVQLRLWDPKLGKKNLQDFTEFEEGLYYLDYDFGQRGTWIGIVCENGNKVTSSSFSIGMRRPGIVIHKKKG